MKTSTFSAVDMKSQKSSMKSLINYDHSKTGIGKLAHLNMLAPRTAVPGRRPSTILTGRKNSPRFSGLNLISKMLPTSKDQLFGSESARSITKWTERENQDISSKLKILNPTHKTIVKKMDDEAERILETMRQDHKHLSLSLKQLISAGITDRTLEPNQTEFHYMLKLKLNKDRNPINIYTKPNDFDDASENEDQTYFDLRMYMSIQNKQPNRQECDFKCNKKYASIDLKKDLGSPINDCLLYIALTSKIGMKILFAYCYERDPPPNEIVKNNLESESFIAAMTRRKLTAKEIIYNRIEEMIDPENYDMRKEFMAEVKRIKAKRANSARTASQNILTNMQKMQAFGMKSKVDILTTNERIK